MEGMLERLLSLQEGRLLVPLVLVVLLAWGIKAIAGLGHTRSSARREFLELFHSLDDKDDLWLTVAIRHHFGAYLPVRLIRRLMRCEQPARALLEVSDAWDLVDVDDETGELVWRKARYRTARRRRWWRRGFMAAYFVVASASVLVGYRLLKGEIATGTAAGYWLLVVEGIVFALWCAYKQEQLSSGEPALKRWLGME